MKIWPFFSKHFSKHTSILIILVVALIVHLVFLPGFHEVWWDSGVYAGMGKHIFSAGSSGLWEHIRPPVLPVVLGLLWFVNLDLFIFGEVLMLALSLGCVFLLYLIAKQYFDEKTALLSSALFAFSSIFFYLSFHLYSEIPALFFVLLSIYLFGLKQFYSAGFFMAIAFLSKFPAGVFIAVLGIVLLFGKDIKGLLKLAVGFVVPVIPVLVVYQVVYGSALLPFIEARQTILAVLGCNVLWYKPWWHYFLVIFTENYLHVFALAGLLSYFISFKKSRLLPLLALAVPLAYFSQMHCRDYRYLTMFIPFVALFTGLGINWLVACVARKSEKLFGLALVLVLGFSVFSCAQFYISNENTKYAAEEMGYFKYLEGREVSGEIWSANPSIALFTDAKINKIYYPVYDKGVSAAFSKYLLKSKGKIEYVLLDNCGGGIICPPDEPACETETKSMIRFLEDNFEKVYDAKKGRCWYRIFKK